MNPKYLSIILGLMLILMGSVSAINTLPTENQSYGNILYVGGSESGNYTPHDPIYINGNDNFTSENGVIGGSGTISEPFLIEGWDIDASSMDGITIRNGSVFFNIRNCNIHDGREDNDGIVFINVTHGVIEDTEVTSNRHGIMFRIQSTGEENSENNSIRNNSITANVNDGIHFEHTGWAYHNNNIISNNNLTDNGRGIYMIMSDGNQILYNNIFSNDGIGIQLDMCVGGGENNVIHHNNFIDNGNEHAFELGGPVNHWDNDYPSGGNYWDDYTGVDSDGDGIGDTPYNIPGGSNQDRYPLMEPYGIAGPFLIIKITGGIGVKIHIRNIGNETAYEINWSVAITGGILGFVDMRVDGTFAELLPGNEIYESNLFLGFGKLEIAAAASSLNAEGVSKIKNGFLLLFFVLILG